MGDIDSAIAALRKAEEYMTRGPWRYDVILDCVNDHADAAGIVAMRNAFSALLDVAEAASRVLLVPVAEDGCTCAHCTLRLALDNLQQMVPDGD